MKADRASIRFRSEATKVDRITIPPIHVGAKGQCPAPGADANGDGVMGGLDLHLHLITCDGYDPATGEFDDNYVVYAKLTNLATAKAR